MLLRRYTPPTCTLEIVAKRSPLARFWGKSLVDELRFELRFDDPRQIQEDPPIARGDREQLDRLCDIVTAYVQDFLLAPAAANLPLFSGTSLVANNAPLTHSPSETLPHLQPQGLLFHDLVLGQLASENSAAIVPLSATQLFDLATALNEYSAEIDCLPQSTRLSPVPLVPVWGKVAALLVVTAGLATAIAQFSQSPQSQLAVTSSSESNSIATAPVEPLPPLPEPPPTPDPDFPQDLSGRGQVNPPPIVTAPPAPNAPFVIPGPPRPLNQSRSSNTSPPPTEEEREEMTSVLPAEEPRLPNLPPVTSEDRGQSQGDLALESTPLSENLPPSPRPEETLVAPSPRARFPDAEELPEAASVPIPSRSAPRASPPSRKPAASIPSTSAEREERARIAEPLEPPRVAQVRAYFQQRWQPPENLPETLEYRLYLANDGSLERITPLSNVARTYLDRTPMPKLGQPFVTAADHSQTLPMRLILAVDGSVQMIWDISQSP